MYLRSKGRMIAAQGQALNKRYHQRNIAKQPNYSKCRKCYKAEGIMKHIVVECTILSPSEYTNRHNTVAGCIHWTVCKHMGLEVTDSYCEHIPEMVININGTAIMWDISVITNRAILANWFDEVLRDKKKTCLLNDIAIADYSHVNTIKVKNLASTKTWRSR